MQIIDEKLNLDIKDTLTHRRFPFSLDRAYNKLVIGLSYDPRLVSEETSKELASICVDRDMPAEIYDEADRKNSKEAIIENFITVSLLYDGKFIGDYHNKNNNQEIIVSKAFSSAGYKKFSPVAGPYELVLSMHSCNCPVNVNLSLEALDE